MTEPGIAVPMPVRVLAAFVRVSLAPGASAVVPLTVPLADVAYWDVGAGAFRVEPGNYQVAVGASEQDLPLSASFTVE